MKLTKLFFAIGIYTICLLFLSVTGSDDNSFRIFSETPLHLRHAYAAKSCSQLANGNKFTCANPCPANTTNFGPGFCGNSAFCCVYKPPPPPPPYCNILTCGGWNVPYNTCYNGNEYRYCSYTAYTGGGYCIQWGNTTQYGTVNNCAAGYRCYNQTCYGLYNITGRVVNQIDAHLQKGYNGSFTVTLNGGPRHASFATGNTGRGYYNFTSFMAGGYTVALVVPSGYALLGTGSYNVNIGPNSQNNDFLITPYYKITGRVVSQINASTQRGVGNVTVKGAGQTVTTNSQGYYTMNNVTYGKYTLSITVPAGYKGITTSVTTTVGPTSSANNDFLITPYYSISGTVFAKEGQTTTGYAGATINITGRNYLGKVNSSTTTAGNGTYLFTKILYGTYTVTLIVPKGYVAVGPTSQSVTVGPNSPKNVNFYLTKLFSITGDVFIDTNIDKIQDNGEPTYQKAPQISSSQGTITTNANGTYTILNLTTGTVTVSYNSLPSGYYMTSPLNGPPPAFTVNIGYACNTNGAPGAACVAAPGPNGGQDITNLNFGIINNTPWIQSICGDIRNDNGITNPQPAGTYAIATNASCSTPGIVFTGNVNANFGKGSASTNNQVVGGSLYSEIYNQTAPNRIYTSYAALAAKAQSAGIMQTSLSTVCTIANCTLPRKLPHGIYTANGNVILNSYNFPVNQNYIFLINGNLTINGNINIPTSSTAIFATSGNIIVLSNVGSNANSPAPDLEGIFSAGKSFIINSSNTCPDLRLNVQGEIIANAGQTGGTLVNNRDLCQFNAIDPTLQITKRLDFLFNLPEFVRVQQTISQEVAP